MKTIISHLSVILLCSFTVLSFVACDKEEIDINQIYGTWSESYNADNFSFDGSVVYTFNNDTTYTLYTSNIDGSSQHTTTGLYRLGLGGDNTITINPDKSDFSNVTYVIVKLTSKEMAWQKQGTTYSHGSFGSDYRHFVKAK